MSRTGGERLRDALTHFDAASGYAADGPLDQRTIDAVCMRIAASIEALNGLAEHKRTELFGDTWTDMWGVRNRITHTYARVEAAVIIATVEGDLPAIRARIMGRLSN